MLARKLSIALGPTRGDKKFRYRGRDHPKKSTLWWPRLATEPFPRDERSTARPQMSRKATELRHRCHEGGHLVPPFIVHWAAATRYGVSQALKSCFHALCCERGSHVHRAHARARRVRRPHERGETLSHDCRRHNALQPRDDALQHGYGVLRPGGGGQQLLLTWTLSVWLPRSHIPKFLRTPCDGLWSRERGRNLPATPRRPRCSTAERRATAVQALVVTAATLIQIMEIEPAAGDIAEMLETVINRQGWRWEWRVQDRSGIVLMRGRAQTRAGARYESERALFLLLLTMVPRQTRTW